MKFFLITILTFVITLCSCKINKTIIKEGNNLFVEEAYIQKIIPGRKKMKIEDFLFINFKTFDTKTYLIDSVYYLNKAYYINKNQVNYRINLSTGVDAKNKEHADSSKKKGTVFYHQNNKLFYKKISDIKRKETLYMP